VLLKEIQAAIAKKQEPPEEAVLDAEAEATVRPEKPITETPAEIRVVEKTLEIVFPERREDFRGIVKDKLKMEWSGRCWRRKLVVKNGTPQDRAAEAGHRLLAAGFVVRIFDPEIRAKAISGDYEPECTRWIAVRNETASYAGWFSISWDRDREDFYKAAKKLPGAHWSKPNVVVPPANFEEVLDFAKMYGFRVSKTAQEIADQARRVRDAALTVKVEAPAEPAKVNISGRPPILEVPENVSIADEFRD